MCVIVDCGLSYACDRGFVIMRMWFCRDKQVASVVPGIVVSNVYHIRSLWFVLCNLL